MIATHYEGGRKFTVTEGTKIAPKADEIRMKVAYTGICGTDLHIYHGVMDKRVGESAIIGHECSGVVDEVGSNVKDFKAGDKVVVRPLDPCGECPACKKGLSHICYNLNFIGVDSPGCMQSYWTLRSDIFHKIPDDMDLKYGALIEPLSVACHDVSRSGIGEGDKAVVIGGGPIGVLVALAAKNAGSDVVISEINDFRRKFAEDMGIKTVNPLEHDLVTYVNEWTDGWGADASFEVSGSQPGFKAMTEVLKVRGKAILVAIYGARMPELNTTPLFLREVEVYGARVYEAKDYELAIELAASGKYPLDKMISKVAPLDQIQSVFDSMETEQETMKILFEC